MRLSQVDLECRRKLAFRARGRLRGGSCGVLMPCTPPVRLSLEGSIEDQGDERQHGNVTKQREERRRSWQCFRSGHP